VAVAGVLNVYLLMLANLAILHGFKDTPIFLQRAFFSEGSLATFIAGSIWLYCGVMYMLEVRDNELAATEIKKI
jgi:hypothetical protein